ncbi:SDR family NAD(P)-dependent oxidoreductase [Flavobacterium sp.]|uniref:SDR family NAD(P)-dependent oxidoreductase n=1 Tax=Flavobacterium sp. TaxID=239 RepID=UPI0025EA0C3A|nr:SDR family NAD(P)-dependent oxidoreductase [Flavobacterium sp.]
MTANKGKQISILGCGWLGLPLAESLIKRGFSVNGSTTTLTKVLVLKTAKVIPFIITLSAVEVSDEMRLSIEAFLEKSDILIIDFPPKLRGNDSENFVAKIQMLIPFIEKAKLKKVVFVSSTSVYADGTSTALSVTEMIKPKPNKESGKQLWETEQLLQNNPNFKTTVIRFGGLIGKNRHPIYFLAGKKNLENPEAPINLIHQTDCIGIIETIISRDIYGEIYNAVTPFHPTRKSYYIQKAVEFELHVPQFDEDKPSIGKTVSSNKIEMELNYKFQHKIL